ncbi:MAG: META domain-containing protein, partial [Acetobacteraceae bacterium]
PFWLLEIVGDRLRFSPMGASPTEATLLPPRATAEGTLHETAPGGPRLLVLVTPGPCRDTMSGAIFPDNVQLTVEGRTVSGCGSSPEGRLIGAAWTVESIAGEASAGRRPVTIEFRAGGRLGGQGPCNVYLGGWAMPEGRLRIDRVASTMMMCPEPMMAQERRLHGILQSVREVRFGEDGSLVIEGGDGASLVARR